MSKLKSDWNKLDNEHKKFVLRVHASNGGKHGAEPSSMFNEEIDEPSIGFWHECEKLGFIACVGSYKWMSTDKYSELVRELFCIK